jgi:hypothetical protein
VRNSSNQTGHGIERKKRKPGRKSTTTRRAAAAPRFCTSPHSSRQAKATTLLLQLRTKIILKPTPLCLSAITTGVAVDYTTPLSPSWTASAHSPSGLQISAARQAQWVDVVLSRRFLRAHTLNTRILSASALQNEPATVSFQDAWQYLLETHLPVILGGLDRWGGNILVREVSATDLYCVPCALFLREELCLGHLEIHDYGC